MSGGVVLSSLYVGRYGSDTVELVLSKCQFAKSLMELFDERVMHRPQVFDAAHANVCK